MEVLVSSTISGAVARWWGWTMPVVNWRIASSESMLEARAPSARPKGSCCGSRDPTRCVVMGYSATDGGATLY